jgi:hypothetical protein
MLVAENKAKDASYHCQKEASEDILILGSSYAIRSFVPSIISDSIGMSCYNAGQAGNGIICAYARLNIFMKKHKPKMVIYALSPQYDYLSGEDGIKYLSVLKPYYSYSTVSRLFDTFGNGNEAIKLKSNLFTYNSIFPDVIKGVLESSCEGLKGYKPLYGEYKPKKQLEDTRKNIIDTKKLQCLEEFVQLCKKERLTLLFVNTPIYEEKTVNPALYLPEKELASKYNIPVINDIRHPLIYNKKELFYDSQHLNDKGARLYSSLLSSNLKKYFN